MDLSRALAEIPVHVRVMYGPPLIGVEELQRLLAGIETYLPTDHVLVRMHTIPAALATHEGDESAPCTPRLDDLVARVRYVRENAQHNMHAARALFLALASLIPAMQEHVQTSVAHGLTLPRSAGGREFWPVLADIVTTDFIYGKDNMRGRDLLERALAWHRVVEHSVSLDSLREMF